MAIAVSGGADSLCLVLLLDEFCKKNNHDLVALTYDHGLRPESYDEALWVHHFCIRRNIKHHILHLKGPKPQTGIQEWARQARYRAFEHFCLNHEIQDLFLAHHLDDQIETFIMRLLAKSSPYGLASMAHVKQDHFVHLKRPLLDWSKKDLVTTLSRFNVDYWIEDPSNLNTKYHRVHIRKNVVPFLSRELSTDFLQKTIQDLRFYRDALEADIQHLVDQYVVYNPIGFAEIKKQVLVEKDILLLYFFKQCLRDIGGKKTFIKQEAFHHLIQKLRTGITTLTLANCLVTQKKDKIYVFRENRHLPHPLSIQKQGVLLWDNRFLISYDIKNEQSYSIEPLGESPGGPLAQNVSLLEKKRYNSAEKRALFSYPSLKGVDGFIHVPHLCYSKDDVFFKVDFLPVTRKNQFDGNKK